MSYFVGYMLEGEAALWHRETAKLISGKFGTWKVHEKVAPHATIFYPFDIEKVEVVVDLLISWTAGKCMPGTIRICDFGRFDDNVVFARIDTPSTVDAAVYELQDLLTGIPLMPRRGFRKWNPHATLAHRVPKETIREIWECIQTLPKPAFSLPFDNVTLFEYERERRWSVAQVFRFP